MSEKTAETEAALRHCRDRIDQIVHGMNGDDLIHKAFMVGLLIGQADKWISEGNVSLAAERIGQAEKYLESTKLAAFWRGIRL
jgi:hypothetical protein